VVANAHVVADLNLIFALGAVTDVVPAPRIGEKENLPRARRAPVNNRRRDHHVITLQYSTEAGDDLV
jgi:hypothetical protein